MTDEQQPPEEGPGATPTERAQIRLILESVPEAVAFPGTSGVEVEYLYRGNKILVRDANLDSVRRGLDERGVPNAVDRELPLAGSTRLTLEPKTDDAEWSLAAELRSIEAVEGPGAAGLDHLFYVCGHSCAAIEPEEVAVDAVPVPRPQVGQDAAEPRSRHGEEVRVLAFDTGLVERAAEDHAWMTGVTGEPDTLVRQGRIHPDGGHGTFAAGCVRVTAPEAKVHVVNAARLLPTGDTDELGAVFESDLADLIRKHLIAEDDQPPVRVPDILLLNFAGTTQGGRPPVALAALYDSVIQHLKELLILSPAGNEGDERKNWPGSFAWVVSVGGLATNWRDRATWSNFGHNVDVYAPGDRLVNAFATGEYECTWEGHEGELREFKGMARWSGTSFSTPLVAGLVASRMSTTGQSSRRAWESLLDVAEAQAVPGVGPVLYPGQELA